LATYPESSEAAGHPTTLIGLLIRNSGTKKRRMIVDDDGVIGRRSKETEGRKEAPKGKGGIIEILTVKYYREDGGERRLMLGKYFPHSYPSRE
jgi:hypothetical protein